MNKPFLKKIFPYALALMVAILAFSYFLPQMIKAIDNLNEGYRLIPKQALELTIHDIPCKKFYAGGDTEYFLPTKDVNEYIAFINNRPSDVAELTCGGLPDPCDTQVISYGGENYTSVKIGDQCWLDRNLNVGIVLASNVAPSDDGVIEKVCPDDTENGCQSNGGGLYRVEEARNYIETGEGLKGICPSGWHIPTLAEIDTLIAHYTTVSPLTYPIVRSYLGPNTPFNGLYTGYAAWAFGKDYYWNWVYGGSNSKIITSTNFASPSTYTYILDLDSTTSANYYSPAVARDGGGAYSVRCLQNDGVVLPPDEPPVEH
ncbi:MAG: fibrobacter succinogenes major paralogous domain-containing protein [Lentimicrobium sp.]|nr:fibrobacter succinogenes major paralogous domain-containing protein [Lentimicrobium sp.]